MILSIDIGRRNLGWVIGNKETIKFGLYDIDEGKKYNSIIDRTRKIHELLGTLFSKYPIETVIIEKQVNKNTVAMELMYLFVSAAYFYCKSVILYPPRLKFTSLAINYSTKNKAHKKLSISLIKNYLERYYPNDYSEFMNYSKQDDISDAALMLLTYMYRGNSAELLKIKDSI